MVYLPESAQTMENINKNLPAPLDLDDSSVATSCCHSCCRELRRHPLRAGFKERVLNCVRGIDSSALVSRACLCAAAQNILRRPNQLAPLKDITDTENIRPQQSSVDEEAKSHTIGADVFASAAAAAHLSGRQAEIFAEALCAASSGRTVVESGVRALMVTRNSRYRGFMSHGSLACCGESTAVWVSKTREFCAAMCHDNDNDPALVCLLRGDIDGGAASVKISFSMLQPPKPQHVKKVSGVSDSGVRKVFTFVYVTGAKETVPVVSEMLALLDERALRKCFPNAKLVWAEDTKLNWMISGQTSGGTHPCVTCEWQQSDAFDNSRKRRTFGGNSEYAKAFVEHTSGKSVSYTKNARKRFMNVVRRPLLDCAPQVEIGDILTPEPLHIKLRCTNKLMTHLHATAALIAATYISELGLRIEGYHGEYEGRACSKIVARHTLLASLLTSACETTEGTATYTASGKKRQRVSPRISHDAVAAAVVCHPVNPFVQAFAAMDGLMKCYYGDTVVDNLVHCMTDFKNAVTSIGCSVSVSMHMLAAHVPEYCAKQAHGLRRVSAESHEALHHESRAYAAQWHVPPVGAQTHAVSVFHMVAGMNACHAHSSLQL